MNCISQICCFHVALISCLAIIRVYHIFVSISTCALREEGDTEHHPAAGKHQYFYPRPPRGGRPIVLASGDLLAIFLSTPSARRATHQVDHVRHIGVISIHALREEGDWVLASAMLAASIFLSTPSARRATLHNPATNVGRLQFLSTPSARRATQTRSYEDKNGQFLSTPSARRATHRHEPTAADLHDFYPRPPRGGRPRNRSKILLRPHISIHALREEGDPSKKKEH